MLHEIGLERRFHQEGFKSIDQAVKNGISMIVTDRRTRLLPNMLLRIEIGTGRREVHQLQTRVIGDELVDSRARMLGSTVEEQENGLGGKQEQHQAEKVRGDVRGLLWGGHRYLATRANLQSPVEVDVVALWANPDNWGLPHRRIHAGEGSLEV